MTQNRWELLTCWEFSGNITCTISTSAQIQWVEHTREVQTTSGICDVTRTKKKVRGLRLQCKTTELPLISYFIRIFFKVVLRNSEGLAVLFFGYWVFFHPLSVQSCTWPFFLDFFSFLFPCLPNHLMLTAESFKHKKVPHSRKKKQYSVCKQVGEESISKSIFRHSFTCSLSQNKRQKVLLSD